MKHGDSDYQAALEAVVEILRDRVLFRWRPAQATWRVRDPRGARILSRITLPDRGWPMEHIRTYWWDPAAIRPA